MTKQDMLERCEIREKRGRERLEICRKHGFADLVLKEEALLLMNDLFRNDILARIAADKQEVAQ